MANTHHTTDQAAERAQLHGSGRRRVRSLDGGGGFIAKFVAMDESKPQDLAALQANLASAVDELRASIKPAVLAGRAKGAVTDKAKELTMNSSGKPKPWVLIAGAAICALALAGLVKRSLKGKAKAK